MSELTVLHVAKWQTLVCHWLPAPRVNIAHVLAGEDTPRVTVGPGICRTFLPAIVCGCGRYLIETVEDDAGPRAVGWEGEIG
jgi:hypothetical protein